MDQLLMELIEYAKPDYDPEYDPYLKNLLDDALDEVLQEMYPFGLSSEKQVEKAKCLALKTYRNKIKKIAQYHFDKQGKEGVVSYSENGTSASYDGAGTPASYLRGIVPVAKIV